MNEKFIMYNELKRDVETNRALYQSLLSSVKERSITEENQAVTVWVVQEAKLPKRPASPNVPRNLLLGLLVGCLGGIGLAFFIEFDQRQRLGIMNHQQVMRRQNRAECIHVGFTGMFKKPLIFRRERITIPAISVNHIMKPF